MAQAIRMPGAVEAVHRNVPTVLGNTCTDRLMTSGVVAETEAVLRELTDAILLHPDKAPFLVGVLVDLMEQEARAEGAASFPPEDEFGGDGPGGYYSDDAERATETIKGVNDNAARLAEAARMDATRKAARAKARRVQKRTDPSTFSALVSNTLRQNLLHSADLHDLLSNVNAVCLLCRVAPVDVVCECYRSGLQLCSQCDHNEHWLFMGGRTCRRYALHNVGSLRVLRLLSANALVIPSSIDAVCPLGSSKGVD